MRCFLVSLTWYDYNQLELIDFVNSFKWLGRKINANKQDHTKIDLMLWLSHLNSMEKFHCFCMNGNYCLAMSKFANISSNINDMEKYNVTIKCLYALIHASLIAFCTFYLFCVNTHHILGISKFANNVNN